MTGKQLKNSILQWAIQGKLVPQDPSDEPASVLLERIRAEKQRLIKEKKIKKPKPESVIYRGDDNSYYEKFSDGTVRCIDDEIPFGLPQGWEWERWGNISISIQYGYNAPAQESGDIRMVRISDIQNNKVLWDSVPFCNIPQTEIDLYKLQPNDILFARTGGTVGKSFLVYETPYDAIFAGYLIRTRYSNELCPQYLKFFMESALYWEQLKNGTIATAQPNCNGQTLSKMFIPIPPKTEQIRIVKKLHVMIPLLHRYSQSYQKLDLLNQSINDSLKKSILQQAIQGCLVPQDPNDEPASVLLERIKTEKAQQIIEKKIKKDKAESVIFKGDDNCYYEQFSDCCRSLDIDFPILWEAIRLGSICQLLDGEKREGKCICLDAKFLRGKSEGVVFDKGRYVSKGDSIILVDGENSGEVFTVPQCGYMGSTFKQLWISEEMHLPYVLYFLLFYKSTLRNSKKGAAIPHLNRDLFNNLIIGIPPLQEQKRIVTQIEKLFAQLK